MKIVKNVSRSYPVSTIWPFGKYGDFVAQRKKTYGGDGKMSELCKCFNCGHPFTDDEDINAAFLTGHTNVFLCSSCVDKLRESETKNKE